VEGWRRKATLLGVARWRVAWKEEEEQGATRDGRETRSARARAMSAAMTDPLRPLEIAIGPFRFGRVWDRDPWCNSFYSMLVLEDGILATGAGRLSFFYDKA
jgi:hypothetical protein